MMAVGEAEEDRIFRKALLARMTEERLLRLFSEGKLSGTLHTCIGQELTGAVVGEFLQPGDTVFSNHRGHGHFLSVVGDCPGLVAELMGRETGVCRGLGGSQHLCRGGYFSNGIQGGIVPVATGLAWAAARRNEGGLSAVFIGDGTLGEGAIYEAFNLAARWGLPLFVLLEDNGIAQSTRQSETFAGDIAARAAGFGLDYARADTWNWREFYTAAGAMIARIRDTHRPGLLHVATYRLKAHSKGDDTRPAEEVAVFARKDPVTLFLARPERAPLVAETAAQVDAAVAAAEAAPLAVYRAPDPEGAAGADPHWREAELRPRERMVRALAGCFHDLMRRDPRITMVGEDIESPYGGAFKATQGLSEAFPGRVRNLPISESAAVGLATGLALAGERPIVEIMFGDFLGLAFDQLVNHAAKFERMYDGQVQVDLVVRTPMGGRRGYGPTHSQTLDRHFLGVPGLRVLALHALLPPAALYEPLFAGRCGAALVIENKLLYGASLHRPLAAGFHLMVSDERFPSVWLRPEAAEADVTLVGYGGMAEMLVAAAERLFAEHDLIAQVLCPMQVHPFAVRPWLPILHRGGALLVAEEGQGFAGFGAEVAAQLAEWAPGLLERFARVVPPSDLIPSSGAMEGAMLPAVETLLARAAALCA
jgi:2-oxoisovalerate dehydrogenase E1 component